MKRTATLVACLLLVALPATATITDKPALLSGDVADAMWKVPGTITGSSFVEYPPGPGAPPGYAGGVSDAIISTKFGIPDGATFAIISTGMATGADDVGTFQSVTMGNIARGANDVTILAVDFDVPSGHNCFAFEFQFLSEEYPTFVGSAYNDAFLAEMDSSTWSVSGSVLTAPNNFAFDPSGSPITINSASMSTPNAAGTAYDGGTDKYTAMTPVTPGAHTVYFSIFDATDASYDSTAFLDNAQTFAAPTGACKPGAKLPGPPPTPEFDWTPTTPCVGDPITFFDNSTASTGWFLVDNWWEVTFNPSDSGAEYTKGSYDDNFTHPGADSGGTFAVTLHVTDNQGFTESITKFVNVLDCTPPPNDPPVIDPIPDKRVGVGVEVRFRVSGSDPDDDPIRFSASNLPGDSTFDPLTRVYSWVPTTPGMYEGLTFRVTEDTSAAKWDETTTNIIVDPEPRSPESGDSDGDGVPDSHDNCSAVPNPGQADSDGNGIGDACDGAAGGQPGEGADGSEGGADSSEGSDEGGAGGDMGDGPPGASTVDSDGDGTPDVADNCPTFPNRDQSDIDRDNLGDLCDDDVDGDTVPNLYADKSLWDNCPYVANRDQLDRDGDGFGDLCDGDRDSDGVADDADNCQWIPNPSQDDVDADGVGDACGATGDIMPWTVTSAVDPLGPDGDPATDDGPTASTEDTPFPVVLAGAALGLALLRRRRT